MTDMIVFTQRGQGRVGFAVILRGKLYTSGAGERLLDGFRGSPESFVRRYSRYRVAGLSGRVVTMSVRQMEIQRQSEHLTLLDAFMRQRGLTFKRSWPKADTDAWVKILREFNAGWDVFLQFAFEAS